MDAAGHAHSPRDLESALAAARSGDLRELSALLEEHLPALRAFVRSKAGHGLLAREAVSDLAQSACLEVLKDLPREEPASEAELRRRLFLAVERKIIDHARYYGRAKRGAERAQGSLQDSRVDAPEELSTRSTPSQDALAPERRARIDRAMQELPPDQREVIRLARIEGLPRDEVARRLRRSPAAVRELLHRALARLDLLVEKHET
jgi:RNA polymerase sigma-70 factor (ECF subfamily)